MGYGGTTNPALLAAIRRADPRVRTELLATTWAESGGRLDAVGDHGQSFGPYQEYSQGRGAGIAPAQRQDPVASTQRAQREFLQYKAKGLSGGALAAAAQRPANQGAYAAKVDSYMADARKVLGSAAVDAITSTPATATGPKNNPAGNQAGLLASLQTAVAARQNGQSLFDAVMRGVMANAMGSPAVTQRNGVTRNPQGNGPGASAADGGSMAAAFRKAEGLPYSWGGGTPNGPTKGIAQGANTVGYDCSSLAQMLWSKQGVSLPRTTYGQIKVGRAVAPNDRNQWAVGDLLFPSTGHVQIYAGNGQVWEAPRTGGHVQQVPVRSSYIAVRRPR